MPIPTPTTGEEQNEFLQRCIEFVTGEGTDQEQAYAICISQWENNKIMDIPEFKTKKERIDFVVQNKDKLIAAKKAQVKHADGIIAPPTIGTNKSGTEKAAGDTESELKRRLVINTTNWMDSHEDVHLPGLWSKSLQENKMIMFLQEHKMAFSNIIADGEELSAGVQNYKFRDLGFDIDGETQALVFDATIKRDRNPYMFEQYKNDRVRNHSVGMQYVKLLLAINDEDYPEHKEVWDKYYPEIANKERADEVGLFWAVKEAKVIEGSAVPIGSNTITPTLEPGKSTPHPQPSYDTEKMQEDLRGAIKSIFQ